MIKRLVLLGSTGSIGTSTLDVVAEHADELCVVGLAAGSNWQLLARQAAEHRVRDVAIADERFADELERACPPGTRVYRGARGLVELVERADANFVLSAIVGAAGLPATLRAVDLGLDVGLANKESLVVAGSLIVPLARQRGGALLPVDSEHSAVFQAMAGGRRDEVARIYLTASGGPFRTASAAEMREATLEQAMRHPTWSMGPKITIDSATMMNKALEIIEAHWLFDLAADQIGVLVHPESIVHSMVEFRDGSTLAQLGTPDMRLPIQFALTFPRRLPSIAPRLQWSEGCLLRFEPPDFERFPALRLGYEAVRRGGTCGAVLNAANETAVERFRGGDCRFCDIVHMVEDVLSRHAWIAQPSLDELMQRDTWARNEVASWRNGR
ncbi:MAG: 1-deoxy-D-xylulose-5-phosphate reductoisomerase [Phycisphaerales bacterium]|nr:1-deoxy-D-xylulose-5-phosphate reductoisomerase [Phycisphaerales bacterium]